MRAITIRQPWAWAVPHAGKNVENRTGGAGRWRSCLGETIAIHAGSAWSDRGARDQRVREMWWAGRRPGQFQGGPAVPAPDRIWRHVLAHPSHDEPDGIVFGAIIALAAVSSVHDVCPTNCDELCWPWGETSYVEANGRTRLDLVHLVFSDVVALRPGIPCRGRLGLWTPDPDTMAELADFMLGGAEIVEI